MSQQRRATWVRHNPNYRVVHGWVCFESFSFFGFIRFTAHSVVEDETGKLWDITPNRAADSYPFIRHPGDPEEFVTLMTENNIVNLDVPLGTGSSMR